MVDYVLPDFSTIKKGFCKVMIVWFLKYFWTVPLHKSGREVKNIFFFPNAVL